MPRQIVPNGSPPVKEIKGINFELIVMKIWSLQVKKIILKESNKKIDFIFLCKKSTCCQV